MFLLKTTFCKVVFKVNLIYILIISKTSEFLSYVRFTEAYKCEISLKGKNFKNNPSKSIYIDCKIQWNRLRSKVLTLSEVDFHLQRHIVKYSQVSYGVAL